MEKTGCQIGQKKGQHILFQSQKKAGSCHQLDISKTDAAFRQKRYSKHDSAGDQAPKHHAEPGFGTAGQEGSQCQDQDNQVDAIWNIGMFKVDSGRCDQAGEEQTQDDGIKGHPIGQET